MNFQPDVATQLGLLGAQQQSAPSPEMERRMQLRESAHFAMRIIELSSVRKLRTDSDEEWQGNSPVVSEKLSEAAEKVLLELLELR